MGENGKSGEKVVIVSCDTHIGPRLKEDLRQYCPKKFLDDYDAFVNGVERRRSPYAATTRRSAPPVTTTCTSGSPTSTRTAPPAR